MTHTRKQSGLTLLEVVVALVIAGIVAAMASRVMQAAQNAQSAVQHREDRERKSWEMWISLREFGRQVASGPTTNPALSGWPDRVQLATRCVVAAGWREACLVTIAMRMQPGVCVRTVSTSTGLILSDSTPGTNCKLLYFVDAAHGGTWSPTWNGRGTLPIALAIVADRDTSILSLGATP